MVLEREVLEGLLDLNVSVRGIESFLGRVGFVKNVLLVQVDLLFCFAALFRQ